MPTATIGIRAVGLGSSAESARGRRLRRESERLGRGYEERARDHERRYIEHLYRLNQNMIHFGKCGVRRRAVAESHLELRDEYVQAAARPRLPVAPDPPEPK
jgi:hypothetical protein